MNASNRQFAKAARAYDAQVSPDYWAVDPPSASMTEVEFHAAVLRWFDTKCPPAMVDDITQRVDAMLLAESQS